MGAFAGKVVMKVPDLEFVHFPPAIRMVEEDEVLDSGDALPLLIEAGEILEGIRPHCAWGALFPAAGPSQGRHRPPQGLGVGVPAGRARTGRRSSPASPRRGILQGQAIAPGRRPCGGPRGEG